MMSTNDTTADDPTETGWTQMGLTLLHRGWSVGKKVAIAGAAISVAPVVVPPLLVFSAFGLALSVPFGIYYAGMVGTERLMQSLLPLDEGQDVRQGNQEEESEMVEEGKDYVDEGDSKPEENAEREGDDFMEPTWVEIVKEGKVYEGKRDSKPAENGGREDEDAIVEFPSERDAVTGEHEEMKKNGENLKPLDERDEMVEEGKGYVSKRAYEPEKNGEREDDVVVETLKERVAVVEEIGRIIDSNIATVDKDFITMEKVEIKPQGVTSTTLNEGGIERAGAEVVQVETGSTVVVEENQMAIRNVAKKGENDLSAVSSEDVDMSEVNRKSDLTGAESRLSVEHVGEVKDLRAIDSASVESPVTSDGEELYTKKQLWDQLRALRTIVGYKAAISNTLPDELGALYVFTGVELPSTVSDSSNLLDLNYKVQYLKSVIGVK